MFGSSRIPSPIRWQLPRARALRHTLLVTVLAPVVGFAGSAVPGQAQIPEPSTVLEAYSPVTADLLRDPPDEDWLMWRRNYGSWGHSPLDQINPSNVSQLRLAWAWTLDPGRQEATPLVHDGVMLLAEGCDTVEALDATNGTLLWQYRRQRVETAASLACANRNAALYEDWVIIGTHDAFLVALDVHSGEVVWERQVGDWTIGQHYSGGPQIIDGKVVAGMSGCYHYNTSCWISAHDAESGEELWRTYVIASASTPDGDSWQGVPDNERWGGSAWMPPSYDPELNLIYVGTGVPVPWGAAQRGSGDGEVLYTNSTLALDADTGEIVWYFQHLPGDNWDQDHPFERLVVETMVAPDAGAVDWLNPALTPGEQRKVVTGVPGKPGIVWTLDAATGEFLWARQTSYQNVIVGVDAEGRRGIRNPDIVPEIGEEVLACPHLGGGGMNWQAVAYNPGTNALYAPTNDTCMTYTLNEVDPVIGGYHASARYRRVEIPGFDGRVGHLTAVDVATGETLWELRQRAGIGGSVLSTGGGLIFVSDDARRFRAFDAATGEVLWEQILSSTAGGYPTSYMVDGVQYVAIPAGGGVNYLTLTPEIQQRGGGNVLYVFRLP